MNAVELEFEEVREVSTTDLNGDIIERLLFAAGFDSELTTGDEGLPVVEIKGDGIDFVLSEPWIFGGSWYIDPKTVVIDVVVEGQASNTVFPVIDTEQDLVDTIEELVEQNA